MNQHSPVDIPDTDRAFVRRSIELAMEHSADGAHGPFGAVIVIGDRVAGEGWNRVVSGADPTAHAEVEAIRDACKRLGTHVLEGATIYCSCEPCPMCLGAIYWARVSRVVFACTRHDAAAAGFDDARLYELVPRDWDVRGLAYAQVSRDEGLRVFDAWRANAGRRHY